MTDARLLQLRHGAQDAHARGQHAEAARLWRQILDIAPEQPDALHYMGQQALGRGDVRAAFDFLRRASPGAPKDPMLQLNWALAARAVGDEAAEMTALDRAIAADLACFPALLAKAELLERRGEIREAARMSRNALAVTPPEERLSPKLQEMAQAARKRVSENAKAFEDFLVSRIGPREAASKRFEEALGIATGRKKAFVHAPTLLNFPGLPAISFYDNEQFPFLAEVENATDAITAELRALLESDADFRPYVRHPPNLPLNQWAALNHSPDWSAWFLWQDGLRLDAHCAQCPQTAALLDGLPMAQIAGAAPSAFFSVLKPHTHIPPHTGVTNTRAIVHLPLIVPEGCRFRVGNHTRALERGHAWVFDDSIEHEAWNDSDATRIILIFDVWNPALSEDERALVAALVRGEKDYYSAS